MRIRLQVLRHQLPPAKVLWNLDAPTTTADFLSHVNDFFPLEAQGWGLEDYAVHLGGYELMHFQQLDNLLKDDDEIVIQPLQTNDVRARYLSGRHQISQDGRHLVDGVAFGRPLLRTPAHPPVHIPPRKRARLDPTAGIYDTLIHHPAFASSSAQTPTAPSDKPDKHVSFDLPRGPHGDMDLDELDDDDDDDEDDDDFEPVSDDESETPSDLLFTPDSENEDETAPKLLNPNSSSAHENESESDTSSSVSDSDIPSSDDDESEDDSDAPSEEGIRTKAKPFHPPLAPPAPPTTQTAPGEGKTRTRSRNRRRRDSKKLAWLKSKGHLPANANRQDLKKWRGDTEERRASESESYSESEGSEDSSSSESDSDSDSSSDSGSSSASDAEPKPVNTSKVSPVLVKKPLVMVPRQIKVKAKTKPSEDKSDEFNKKREALLAAIQAGGVDVNRDLSIPSEKGEMADGINPLPESEPDTLSKPEARRARLDVASSNRLLFGSLGVRAPKTDAERQRLQAKLAQPQRKPVTKPASTTKQPETVQEEDDPTDIDAWKSKISLSAVECAPGSEEYYYTTPPFPFYQRWDPSQRTKKRKRASQPFDVSKSLRTEEELDQSYSEYYNEGAEGDALDYGDGEDGAVTTAAGAGAMQTDDQDAASAQLLLESSDAADLPPLPSDLSTLPSLTLSTAVPGAIITFSRLEVSAATNWAPAMSPIRTALIRWASEEETLSLQLAKRDIPGKQYDEHGRRLFDKFEMITGDEEEEDDDGVLDVAFAELVDPRLLQAPATDGKDVENGVVVDVSAEYHAEVNGDMVGIAL